MLVYIFCLLCICLCNIFGQGYSIHLFLHSPLQPESCYRLFLMRLIIDLQLWQYQLWSFQGRDTKLERFLAKSQYTQRKLLTFVNLCNGEASKSAKIWLSKSIFYVRNYRNLSDFFFIEEYEFRSTLFVIDILWYHQFLNTFIF